MSFHYLYLIFPFFLFFAVSLADHVSPDVHRTFPEIIRSYNVPIETYNITTADGYILSLFKIPSARPSTRDVLLVHGLAVNVASWVFGGPSVSIPMAIHNDTSFNTWILAMRGTTHSLSHTIYITHDDQFWDFTLDQITKYDLPTAIAFIRHQNSTSKLTLIGHSQGSANILGCLALNPSLQSYIDRAIVLAPAVSLRHVKATLFKYLAKIPASYVTSILGHKSFLGTPAVIERIIPGFCSIVKSVCRFAICLLTGCTGLGNVAQDRVAVITAHAPDTTSVRNLIQFSQMVSSHDGLFRMYDYGDEKTNFVHYGSSTPPVYPLHSIKVPLYLWSFKHDALVTPKDALEVSKMIPWEEWEVVEGWGHGDVLWDQDLRRLFLNKFLNQLTA
ncbi:hypothetical protein GEMRC1_001874 [Eukaryota sp. GEM-RC1]